MRTAPILLALATLTAADPTPAELSARIDELTKRVEAQDAKIKQLETKLKAPRRDQNGPRGPDGEALAAISLPDQPTKAQVRTYIGAIAAASTGQNMFGERDPQVAMLAAVGPQHVDELIAGMAQNSLAHYLPKAIALVATDEHRDLIIKRLPVYKDLAEVVLKRGWAADAKEALRQGLLTTDYLPDEWLRCATELGDPSFHPAFIKFLIDGNNRSQTWECIKDVPELDLQAAIPKAWAKCRDWERDMFCPIALEHGVAGALLHGAILLDTRKDNEWAARRITSAIRIRASDGGGVDWTPRWLVGVAARLTWDPTNQAWTVPEGVAPPPTDTGR